MLELLVSLQTVEYVNVNQYLGYLYIVLHKPEFELLGKKGIKIKFKLAGNLSYLSLS